MAKLTKKQREFAEAYVDFYLEVKEAAEVVGSTTTQAKKWLKLPHVKEYV